jgi:curved DNA-binding protein CbpA
MMGMDAVSQQSFIDYYELLGISTEAKPSEIRTGYLNMAKTHHPDRGGSVEMMRQINRAYRTLTDHFSRAAYDRLHRLHYKMSDDTELRYGADPRYASKVKITDDEYADFFVDSLYNEYHNLNQQKTPFKTWFSRIVSKF